MNNKVLCIFVAILSLAVSCQKGKDILYMLDPEDSAATTPLVSVLYDPGALGDRSYNDLIYRGVEDAARQFGLRTLQLSPSSLDEGMNTIQTLFAQMSAAQDTIRRLFIISGASYDGYVREHSSDLESNPYTDLLYLETTEPLAGKGSTIYLSYYGAMYEAGAVAPAIAPEVLLVAANPSIETVSKAVDGFTAGFESGYVPVEGAKNLFVEYLAENPGEGFSIADSTAIRIMYSQEWEGHSHLVVPICGGAAGTFQRMCDSFEDCQYMGIDATVLSPMCQFSAVKHIDRAVALCIGQWLSGDGIPKHQNFFLDSGYTEVVLHPFSSYREGIFSTLLPEDVRKAIHESAIAKEAEYEK